MGLFDQVAGAVSGMAGDQKDGQDPLVSVVLGMITNQQSGGLAGLVQQFQQKGLGSQMASWIGTGRNLPVSGEQIAGVLGSDQVTKIAQQLGMSSEQASAGLAGLLPNIIDRLTPNGALPDQSALSGDLGSIIGRMLTR
jgi:uncharacterized protein YidB (DUF937 family)